MGLKKYLTDCYRFLNPRYQNLFSEFPVEMKPRYHDDKGHSLLYDIIHARRDKYELYIRSLLKYKSYFESWMDCDGSDTHSGPCWNNGFLPALDMMALYTMITEIRPDKYVEIGSGNSTMVVHQAIQDHKIKTGVISIDPVPRRSIDDMADVVIRDRLERIDLDLILSLNKGDILFIDNSHRILPNSDAMVVFMDILPRLSSGVIVHIHDIYLPYDYPQFMCDRFYSEQYGLAINLMANPKRYVPLFPCFYVHRDSELSSALSPLWDIQLLEDSERHGGSFWFEIC